MRRYLILDCCFSATVFREFQSAPLATACAKLQEHFPSRGTALLCSSNAKDASLVPPNERRTMFSDALVEVLCTGDLSLGPRFSISELSGMIRTCLQQKYKNSWVRPEVHSPDQRDGEIADILLFPIQPTKDDSKRPDKRRLCRRSLSQKPSCRRNAMMWS